MTNFSFRRIRQACTGSALHFQHCRHTPILRDALIRLRRLLDAGPSGYDSYE